MISGEREYRLGAVTGIEGAIVLVKAVFRNLLHIGELKSSNNLLHRSQFRLSSNIPLL